MLIDSHCHLNDPAFEETLSEVIARAKAAGVSRFIVPAYDFESLGRTAELAASSPGVIFPAFGIHPWHVQEPIIYERVLGFIRQNHPVAIGEIGLDFSPECPPHELQIKSLTQQLEWISGVRGFKWCRGIDRLQKLKGASGPDFDRCNHAQYEWASVG